MLDLKAEEIIARRRVPLKEDNTAQIVNNGSLVNELSFELLMKVTVILSHELGSLAAEFAQRRTKTDIH